ncbi:MAG TPA: amidase family protein, partial [Herpetosiphonaceae bacterium]
PFLVGRVDLHPACRRGLDEAKKLLVELGHEVEEAAPAVDQIALSRAFLTMLCVELAAEFAEIEPLLRRKVRLEDVEPATWALKLLGEQISGREHALALRTLQRASRQLGEFFSRYDVLLTPTLAAPPLPIGSQQITGAEERLIKLVSALRAGRALKVAGVLERNAEQAFAFTPYTPLFNITGQPAMSVPLHWEGGLPIGAHFAGRYGEEETLLSLAGQLERARPWADRRPPLLEAAA